VAAALRVGQRITRLQPINEPQNAERILIYEANARRIYPRLDAFLKKRIITSH